MDARQHTGRRGQHGAVHRRCRIAGGKHARHRRQLAFIHAHLRPERPIVEGAVNATLGEAMRAAERLLLERFGSVTLADLAGAGAAPSP
jgi:hypothetical protein